MFQFESILLFRFPTPRLNTIPFVLSPSAMFTCVSFHFHSQTSNISEDHLYEVINRRNSDPPSPSDASSSDQRSLSYQYAGSETESDIYYPYVFYGNDEVSICSIGTLKTTRKIFDAQLFYHSYFCVHRYMYLPVFWKHPK